MASPSFISFRPAGVIRASASSNHSFISSSQSPSRWWTPLFGWSADPDYMNSSKKSDETTGSRFAPGGFTEEKAKQLRMKTAETTTFHDIMYHSAIASRLASDVNRP